MAAVRKRYRVHDVVGVTVAAQIAENGEFARLRRGAEIAADWTATLIGDADRTVGQNCRDIRPRAEQALGRALAELPEAAERKNLRMQDRHAGGDARYVDPPAARSSWAKPSRKSLESARLRASVISQRMTGWVASPAAGSNTIRLSPRCRCRVSTPRVRHRDAPA